MTTKKITTDIEMATAFKAALKYLSTTHSNSINRKFYNICSCIAAARADSLCSYGGYIRARNVISERLGSHSFFTGWLREAKGMTTKMVNDDIFHNEGRKVQATRKAWLKSLIKEFS